MRRRKFFEWHSVIGLTTGLMLFVICWSGTIAVFAYEIDWLLDPALQSDRIDGELNWPAMAQVVAEQYPTETISWLEAPRHNGFAAMAVLETPSGALRRVYINPATLDVLGSSSYFNVQRFFRSLHMSLFQANYFQVLGIPVGYFAVLFFAFPLFAMLVTSLVFYRRWWRGLSKLQIHKGAGAFWSDMHKLSGVWSLPLVAIICLTSFWYLAEWWLPNESAPAGQIIAPVASSAGNTELPQALETARNAFPQLQIRQIFPPADDGVAYRLMGHDGGMLTRGRAAIDVHRATGAVLSLSKSQDLGAVARIKETVDVLHFGTFGGLWTQVLYFVLGLALSGLALSGAYLHAKRRKRRGDLPPMSASREIFIAYAVTVGLLLLATKAGWDEISAYALAEVGLALPIGATVFIILWTVSALLPLSVWLWKLR